MANSDLTVPCITQDKTSLTRPARRHTRRHSRSPRRRFPQPLSPFSPRRRCPGRSISHYRPRARKLYSYARRHAPRPQPAQIPTASAVTAAPSVIVAGSVRAVTAVTPVTPLIVPITRFFLPGVTVSRVVRLLSRPARTSSAARCSLRRPPRAPCHSHAFFVRRSGRTAGALVASLRPRPQLSPAACAPQANARAALRWGPCSVCTRRMLQ